MKCELLLLDYDGTLCDTKPAITHSITKTFGHFGRESPSEARITELITHGVPITEAFHMLSKDLDYTPDRAQWIAAYRDIYHEEGDRFTRLYATVEETLAYLAQRRIPLVVLSNKGVAAIHRSLKQFGLSPYMDMVVGDGTVTDRKMELKPHRMIFDEIIRPRFPSVDPEHILMTGDTKADIDFGNNCGIRTCWASYGYGHPVDTRHAAPHFTISSFGELRDLLTV